MIEYLKGGIKLGSEFIPLQLVVINCIEAEIKQDNLALIKIEWNSFRGFDGCSETRALPLKTCKAIKDFMVGKMVYFGEIAGKHSDVFGKVEEKHVEIITDKVKVKDFYYSNPSKMSYNYSFLDTWYERACDSDEESLEEEGVTKDQLSDFGSLIGYTF